MVKVTSKKKMRAKKKPLRSEDEPKEKKEKIKKDSVEGRAKLKEYLATAKAIGENKVDGFVVIVKMKSGNKCAHGEEITINKIEFSCNLTIQKRNAIIDSLKKCSPERELKEMLDGFPDFLKDLIK